MICPYHAAVSQLELLESTFGEAGKDPNFPFSPTAAGTFMTKPAMIKAANVYMVTSSAPSTSTTIRSRGDTSSGSAGPGTWPGTASRSRSSCGSPDGGSNTIWRYLRDATLASLTKDYMRGRVHHKHSELLHDTAKVKLISTVAFDRMKKIEEKIK